MDRVQEVGGSELSVCLFIINCHHLECTLMSSSHIKLAFIVLPLKLYCWKLTLRWITS